jgi:predicted phage terminase large subunit-like protein
MGFEVDWLNYYDTEPWRERKFKNVYIVADPASRKRNKSEVRNDFTAMWVIGLGEDKNYYVLDGVRDRLSLTERCQVLHDLHRTWMPLAVGYEEYGKDADIEHFEDYQSRIGYRFEIIPLGGNQHSKEQRIMRLAPKMEEGRFYFPKYGIWRKLKDGRRVDIVAELIEDELEPFPLSKHDDAIDALSRILDPKFPTVFPDGRPVKPPNWDDEYERLPDPDLGQRTWMSA